MQEHPSRIVISDYHYNLPDELVPRFPLDERDQSRLLTFKNRQIGEDRFENIAEHLPSETLLIFNETRVIPARLFFKNRNQKQIEIFCLEPDVQYVSLEHALLSKGRVVWNCLVGGLRSWKEEELIEKRGGISLVVRIQQKLEGFVSIEFTWTGAEKSFSEILKVFGNLPIPPYLNRATQASDWQQYQTVYSRAEGSVAAPTAGLHFTPRVFNRLKMAGIKEAKVILHVGAGTFQPVKSERLEGHRMHAEYIEFDADFVKQLLVQSPKPIIAVGTTSLRTIESMYWMGLKAAAFPEANLEFLEVNQWEPYDLDLPILSAEQSLQHLLRWMEHHQCVDIVCRTRILIAPPYQLKLAGGIITNFHQPQSTLLLLISAIVGAQWRDIYDYALTHQFRFLSYGDSSLLLK